MLRYTESQSDDKHAMFFHLDFYHDISTFHDLKENEQIQR